MIYTASITTKAKTPATSKKRSRLYCTDGLVYKVEIDMPHGSAGLLHCQILDQGFQLWPTTQLTDFASPGFVISFEDTYLKTTAPYHFDVLTWNTDTELDHYLQVRIGMVSKQAFMARFMPGIVYEDMLKLLKEAQYAQDYETAKRINDPFGETD